ncbi:MAG: hypothetical protein B0A82_21820 [Alkalinema sp. CACIAM 70d]|nr:MAG: hypothetical protein B0A82_21820 [Alkalinema sp. CACIAM 70d]
MCRLGFESKVAFAKSLLMGKSTVDKFFAQQPIQLDSFQRICEGLQIEDWRSVAELTPILEQTEAEIEQSHSPQAATNSSSNFHSAHEISRVVTVEDRETGEIQAEIILEGDLVSVESNFATSLEVILRSKVGSTITIKDIRPGSIRITIQGSQEDIAKLIDLINSKKIIELENFPVEEVQILSSGFLQNTSELRSSEKWEIIREITNNPQSSRKLQGQDLSDGDLSGAYLIEADLRGANLSAANLFRADLFRANFSAAFLNGVNLNEVDFRGANLSGADLSRADLSGADLSRADLSGAHLNGSRLRGADLSGADLSEARLNGAHLNGADLSGAHLNGADLNGAHLNGADLSGAHLRKTNLRGADLRKADLRKANLSGANLRGANLRGVNLRGADLSEANLCGADVSNALFINTTGLSSNDRADLERRGAIFEDNSGDRSSTRSLVPR